MTSLRANSVRTRSSPYFVTDYSNNVSNYNAYSLSDIATAEKAMDKKDVQHLNDFRNTVEAAISRQGQNHEETQQIDMTNQVENAYSQRPFFNKTMGKRVVVGKPAIHTDVFDGSMDVVGMQQSSGQYVPNSLSLLQMLQRGNKDSLSLGTRSAGAGVTLPSSIQKFTKLAQPQPGRVNVPYFPTPTTEYGPENKPPGMSMVKSFYDSVIKPDLKGVVAVGPVKDHAPGPNFTLVGDVEPLRRNRVREPRTKKKAKSQASTETRKSAGLASDLVSSFLAELSRRGYYY